MSLPSWVAGTPEINSSLARGTGRQALPIGDGAVNSQLAILAGMAAYIRLQLPNTPAVFEQNQSPSSIGLMVDDAIRAALIRYFKANRDGLSDAAVQRVFDLFSTNDYVVHPFDYIELEHLLRYKQSLFDVKFRRWASQGDNEDIAESDITLDNWTEFAPAERSNYISTLHSVDPEAARALLLDALPDETASVRGKLIQAIESSITISDKVFLEGLLNDRAKSIKDRAATMLSYLPGTEQNNERFKEAVSRLSLKKTKLTRKNKLMVEQPKGYKNHSYKLIDWYGTTFGGIDPIAVAAKLELKPAEFCNLIEQPYLACQCVIQLAKQNELELLKPLAMQNSDVVLAWLFNDDEIELYSLSLEVKNLFWAMATKTISGKSVSHWVQMLESLYLKLNTPIPKDISLYVVSDKKILAAISQSFEESEKYDKHLLERLVSILDACSYPQLKNITKDAPPFVSTYANQLIDLLSLLDNQNSTDQTNEN